MGNAVLTETIRLGCSLPHRFVPPKLFRPMREYLKKKTIHAAAAAMSVNWNSSIVVGRTNVWLHVRIVSPDKDASAVINDVRRLRWFRPRRELLGLRPSVFMHTKDSIAAVRAAPVTSSTPKPPSSFMQSLSLTSTFLWGLRRHTMRLWVWTQALPYHEEIISIFWESPIFPENRCPFSKTRSPLRDTGDFNHIR